MHTFTHLFTHSLSSSPLNLSHTHSLTLPLSLAPPSPTHSHTHTHSPTHSHTLPQSLTHSHTHSLPLSLPLTHSPTHPLPPTLTHILPPTHTQSATSTHMPAKSTTKLLHNQLAPSIATIANLAPDPFRTRCVGCQACSMDTFTLHTHIGQWYLGATPSTPSETAKQRQGHVGPVFAEAMECVTHNQLHT